MKRILLALLPLSAVLALRAEEDMFVSLTRSAVSDKRLPTNVSRLSAADLEALGVASADEALTYFPSVILQKSGTLGTFSTVRLRGAPSSAQQQVLIDDVPLLGVSGQFTDLSQIPLSDIDRIEMVRGGASVLYGANTVGGVIHVLTKRPVGDRPLTRLKGEFRSRFTQIYEGDIGGRAGRADAYVSAGRSLTDGFQENQDADLINASVNTGYTFENGARVSWAGSVVDGEVGNPKGTSLPLSQWDGHRERAPVDSLARVDQKSYRQNGKVFLPLGEGSLQSMVYSTDQRYTAHGSTMIADADQRSRLWGNDTRLQVSDRVTVGVSHEWDGQWAGAFLDPFFPAPERANHITNTGAYGQVSLPAGPLTVMPGLRFDHHSLFGGVWNPRLTLVWRALKGVKVSGNAARAYRAPSLVELYYKSASFNGNPRLNPETAWTYDVGVAWGEDPGRRLSVTGFYTRIRDRISVNAAFDSYENAPQAETSGVEVESRHRLLSTLEGRTVYTYTRALGSTLASSRRAALRLTPRHMGSYHLQWRPGRGWGLSTLVQYVSRKYQLDGQKGLDLPPYALWGVRLSKKILAADLSVACDNILNRRYASDFDAEPVFPYRTTRTPQPGRTFWAGATVRFAD